MQQFSISPIEDGRRLDQYLYRILPNASSSFIHKMIRKKNITVNRKKTEGNYKLIAGDSVELFFSDETYVKFSGKNNACESAAVDIDVYKLAYKKLNEIKIVYEDDDFIFIDKPVGVLSQNSKDNDLSINEWLIGYLLDSGTIDTNTLSTFKPAFCNRLDRNTSGLVLGGKNLKALQFLSNLIRDKELGLHKYYVADVCGSPDSKLPVDTKTFIDLYAKHHKNTSTNTAIVTPIKIEDAYNISDSAIIHTGVRLMNSDDKSMKLEIELHTGKTHQIRAHMAALGHPIIGDPKYGMGKDKTGFQMLRAYRVVFPICTDYPRISEKEFVI